MLVESKVTDWINHRSYAHAIKLGSRGASQDLGRGAASALVVSKMKQLVQGMLRPFDLQLAFRSDSVGSRRVEILRHLGVTHLFDVGANEGQYVKNELRRWGYDGEVISIEPLAAPFAALAASSAADERWRCVNAAIGRTDGELTVNVAAFSPFSSALAASSILVAEDERAAPVATERVRSVSLDELVENCGLPPQAVIGVKADVQGYESAVLDGAENALNRAVFVELEMSFCTLYEGEPGIVELIERMYSSGFRLGLVDNEYRDANGMALQMNGIFVRDENR